MSHLSCQSVLEQLDGLPQSKLPESISEHLQQCTSCSSAAQRIGTMDQQISSALQDVEVPTDLRDRLHAMIEAETAVVAPQTPAKRRSRSAWGWAMVGAAVAAVLLISLWMPRSPIAFEEAQRQLAVFQDPHTNVWTELTDFDEGFAAQIPNQLNAAIDGPVLGVNLDKPLDHEAAVFHFTSGEESGVIAAISSQRLTDGPQLLIPRMTPSESVFAWRSADSNVTYICYLHTGNIEKLHERLFSKLT